MSRFRNKLLYLAFILATLLAGQAWAAPSMKIVSPPKKVTLGEQFLFQIKLEWPDSEAPYEVRADNPLFENLTLLHQGQSEETGAAVIQAVITLELRASKTGEGRVLPFEVRYRKPGTEAWQSLPVAGQKILIVPAFPWQAVSVVLFTLLGAVVTVVTLVTFTKWRKAARQKISMRPPDPKQRVYAHAEETLTTYKGETQHDTVNRWANEVKQVVATYYDIPLKTATESEILNALKSRSLASGEFAEISRLFREIEQLKFTPHMLPVREMETLQKTLLQYVRGKIIIENPTVG